MLPKFNSIVILLVVVHWFSCISFQVTTIYTITILPSVCMSWLRKWNYPCIIIMGGIQSGQAPYWNELA